MNLERTPQRIQRLTLALLIGSAIILTILDSTGTLDNVLAFVRDPAATATAWTSQRTDNLVDLASGPRNLDDARQEIARLEAENSALLRELEENNEAQSELQLLQSLFDRAAETPEYRRTTSTVIGYDTNPAIRSILINKGRDDGVRVGMPVESDRGLVGQVYRTSNNAAQVALLTETASAIPVRLGNSRATGILRGGGRGQPATIDWIDLQYQVEPGEQVMTSGLGGKFPQNLIVGRVIDVERNEAELFQRAIVQPATDFQALEMVLVITDFESINTEIFEPTP